LYTLYLFEDGTLMLHHEHWAPGGAKEAVLDEYSGTWSCHDGKVLLSYAGYEDLATYKEFGENLISVNPRLMSLHLKASNSFLSSLILTEFSY